MTKDTGGPAFPEVLPSNFQQAISGMTLRDFFAGHALAGFIHADGAQFFARFKEHAAMAYAQADAMIAERNKP